MKAGKRKQPRREIMDNIRLYSERQVRMIAKSVRVPFAATQQSMRARFSRGGKRAENRGP
jgi:hypothetical protein